MRYMPSLSTRLPRHKAAHGQPAVPFAGKERPTTLVRSGFLPVPPGAKPGFDHADVYHDHMMGTTRLYVAHTGANRIDVIASATNTYLCPCPVNRMS